jgi:hypothetical protein
MLASNIASFTGHYDVQVLFVVICSALSLYNGLELLVLIFTTFRKWRGLYFWSLTVATLGIFPYCLGFIARYFTNGPPAVGMAIDSVGWVMLITGQSVVLYSRLHLVLDDVRILRGVKWMIIWNAVTLHSLTTVVFFGSVYGSDSGVFSTAYDAVEKIQMTLFTIQEFVLSGIYIWRTVQLLQVVSKERVRRVVGGLLLVNIVVIFMDIGLLVVEYKNFHVLEQVIKSFIYSVKLKLEFVVLGKLVDLVRSSQQRLSTTLTNPGSFVNLSHQQSNASAAAPGRRKSLQAAPQWIQDLESAKVAEHREYAQPELTSRPRSYTSGLGGDSSVHQWKNEHQDSSRVGNTRSEYADFLRSLAVS